MNNLTKNPVKMTLIAEAAIMRDVSHRNVGLTQQAAGLLNTIAIDVLCRGYVKGFFEIPTERTD